MKKIKFKQRVENARHAFFAEENFDANDFLSFRNQSAVVPNEKSDAATRRTSAAETIFKQVFFYFPGTAILFFMSLGFPVLLVEIYSNPAWFSLRSRLVAPLLVFLAAVLMTWLGLGDVRKPKHCVIPASVIAFGIASGAVVVALALISNQMGQIIFRSGYLTCLLPLALVVPFLAKGWVDRDS